MLDAGFDIGSHTVNHPILPEIAMARATEEIRRLNGILKPNSELLFSISHILMADLANLSVTWSVRQAMRRLAPRYRVSPTEITIALRCAE